MEAPNQPTWSSPASTINNTRTVTQKTTTTNSNTVTTTPSTLPFISSRAMEHRQTNHFGLRVLKSNEDDQREAFYRRRIYTNYDAAVAVHSNTNNTATTAYEATPIYLIRLDQDLQIYIHLLCSMEEHTDGASPSQCLATVEKISGDFEACINEICGGRLANILDLLSDQHEKLQEAIEILTETVDVSSADRILELGECSRLMRELRKREREMGVCLENVKMGVGGAQEGVRKLCFVAAEFLRGGKLRHEPGIEDVCGLVEEMGTNVGRLGFEGGWDEGSE